MVALHTYLASARLLSSPLDVDCQTPIASALNVRDSEALFFKDHFADLVKALVDILDFVPPAGAENFVTRMQYDYMYNLPHLQNALANLHYAGETRWANALGALCCGEKFFHLWALGAADCCDVLHC